MVTAAKPVHPHTLLKAAGSPQGEQHQMKHTRKLTIAAAAVAAAIAIAGCSGGTPQGGHEGMQHPTPAPAPPSAPTGAPHNQADVTFTQGMIPHHAQAIDMARLAEGRAQSPEVKNLARQIEAAQGPEIDTMTSWLRSWGAPVPTGMPGMEHGGHGGMQGGMSPEDMQQLGQASGAEFDRMFLSMMITHHEGAISMAQTELATGQDPAAKQLAQQIIDTQQAEIRTMQGLLPQG